MTIFDQKCAVLSCCWYMCSKCVYGASDPKLLDTSMCFVDILFAKCVQCNLNCCANPSHDCCFSCENYDKQFCTVYWLGDVGRMCNKWYPLHQVQELSPVT
jgi:hypothetical protein